MVKNKSYLYISIILLLTLMVINFPFPHRYPFVEVIFMKLQIPIRFANGFHTIGIISIILFIISLFLLVKSVKKYYGRVLLIAIVFVALTPPFIISSYQSTLATGIYAVSYASEESRCYFDKTDKNTLHGECELIFKNHSNNDIAFAIEFYEELVFADDLPLVSLMNKDAPYKVMLGGGEHKRVEFETNIDVSTMEAHIESGEATGIDIVIMSEGKSRDL